ncbi:MAG: hypothetical protein GY820_30485 [Gammaproteobacteria bacterium]|nr:hypothetical protein [Gammaproteobacteria bacterium]
MNTTELPQQKPAKRKSVRKQLRFKCMLLPLDCIPLPSITMRLFCNDDSTKERHSADKQQFALPQPHPKTVNWPINEMLMMLSQSR